MTDHPVIFSAPMIRALLKGRKTMTRRLAWREPVLLGDRQIPPGCKVEYRDVGSTPVPYLLRPSLWQKVKTGDRLWVRVGWDRAVAASVVDHFKMAIPGFSALLDGTAFIAPVEPTLEQQNAAWREVDKQGFSTEDTEVAPIYRAFRDASPYYEVKK